MRSAITILSLFLVATLAFMSTAYAAALTGDEPLLDIAREAFEAVLAGNYPLGAMVLILLAVAAARKHGPKLWAPLGSKPAGALLALVAGAVVTVIAALQTGTGFSVGLAGASVMASVLAIGLYRLAKELVAPLLLWLRPKMPMTVQVVIDGALWFLGQADPDVKAKADGDAAVEANPPTGVEGVVGEPKDVR
jgi:hypothetical protein